MKIKPDKLKIHTWDGRALFSALIFSAVLESLAVAPLVIYGMGHAGPNGGGLGYLSLFLNLFGISIAAALTGDSRDFTWFQFYSITFVAQTLVLSYISFVIIRKIKIGRPTYLSLK
jgi:hypothetical protein